MGDHLSVSKFRRGGVGNGGMELVVETENSDGKRISTPGQYVEATGTQLSFPLILLSNQEARQLDRHIFPPPPRAPHGLF